MKKALPLLVAASLTAAGCLHTRNPGPVAMARLEARSGSSASGSVRFTELGDGNVRVDVSLAGLTPGSHGFHVHDSGDCSAPDASSAGPHFDPTSAPHGSPSASSHHAGDFGNVLANERGEVNTTFKTRAVTVSAGASSVIGRAVLVHADPDDLSSQPAGNSGKRILCGVATMSSDTSM